MDAQFMQNCPRSQTSEKLVVDSMKWGKDKLQLNIHIFQLMVEFDLSIFCMTLTPIISRIWLKHDLKNRIFTIFLLLLLTILFFSLFYRECTRGGFCNFMHLKPISRELRRELYGRSRRKVRR